MYCTSLDCHGDHDHCPKCSHGIYFGSGMVNGREWKWTFNPRFGPVFLKKDGEPRKRQPEMRNPVWGVFKRWYDENIR